ncbi:MAG: hypothetical protein JWR75_229 [Devosia sp.]|nr:hypothetical protein [Devosia sp.]
MRNNFVLSMAILTGLAMPNLSLAQATTSTDPAAPTEENAASSDVSATKEGAAVSEFTPEMVDPADPFGEIDVTSAGTTQAESSAFFATLTEGQQVELGMRCAVILNPVHQERYAEETASVLCRNLLAAELIAPPEDAEPTATDVTTPVTPATK